MRNARRFTVVAVVGSLLVACGCVRRTMTIHTEPQGAHVFLNNEEIGTSPVSVDFTWYGDYELTFRKPGFQTVHTNYRLDAPWYQLPGIDFFSEVLVPYEIHDQRTLPVYTLEPYVPPDEAELVQRADEMRARAVFEGGK
jgi:hypothetical protein